MSKTISKIICRRCGEEGLHWVLRSGAYVLFDNDEGQHLCKTTLNIDPCPFCGEDGIWDIDGRINRVRCTQCGASGPTAHGGPMAVRNTSIERWNRRK